MIKILTIVGARPQFVKASAISRAIKTLYTKKISEIIVHTGQHYDDNMSSSFFKDLSIPEPKYNLGISGGNHGQMTGRMIEKIESVLMLENPDWVLLYGDTNSTLAGAIAAVKLEVPIAHVESGLRSRNMKMPEEVNRILTDRVSSVLFCPTELAVANLLKEGIHKNVYNVGDVMYDNAIFYGANALENADIKKYLGQSSQFILTTIHRAENTDSRSKLLEILKSLDHLAKDFPVIFPIHPRTLFAIKKYGYDQYMNNIYVCEPLSFFEMIMLEKASSIIITDSGGVQKEAFFYKTQCLTIRDETEWEETIRSGVNRLVPAKMESIVNQVYSIITESNSRGFETKPYGNGDSALKIINQMLSLTVR